ncbi:MAG: hypothetical protein N2645_08445 [Clostridia bacterium]|nr:hypothetical protein [Clostridia bacterium]
MDKMSLFSILLVSVPEAICNIFVGFVLTGQRNKLYLNDFLNIIRFVAAVILMVLTAVVSRSLFSNLLLILLCNVVLYTITLKYVYNIKWLDAFLSVFLFCGLLITAEILYLPPYAKFLNKNISELISSDVIRFLTCIPERAIQIWVAISFWKWDLVYLYLKLKGHKKILYTFFVLAIILLSTEVFFAYATMHNLDKMTNSFAILYAAGNSMFAVVNYLICKLIIMLAKNINPPNE